MNKTAMQIFIDELTEEIERGGSFTGLRSMKSRAIELLNLERKQITDAVMYGRCEDRSVNAHDYFTQHHIGEQE